MTKGLCAMRENGKKAGIAAVITALALGCALGFFIAESGEAALAASEKSPKITVAQQTEKPKYLLSSYQGKLAVFMIGKKEPEMVFDRYLHYLPDVDREKLENGIEVAEYSELLQLIEDYTS